MSAKDNFAQAMKELLNGEVEMVEKDEKKPATSSSFSSFSQPEPKRQAELRQEPAAEPAFKQRSEFESLGAEAVASHRPAEKPAPAPAPAPAAAASGNMFHKADYSSKKPAPAPAVTPAPEVAEKRPMPILPPLPEDGLSCEATVIAPGTTVMGDIATAGSLRVGGNIKGNVKVASMMELNGKVIGDIEASDVIIVGSIIRGNVTVQNVLTMDGDTTIIGDVTAKNVDINGKIKGNLTVDERGHFQSSAVLVGNLMSGTVIIDEGAMLKGDISITSAQADCVAVDEPEFDID